jgi:hypothetical protein
MDTNDLIALLQSLIKLIQSQIALSDKEIEALNEFISDQSSHSLIPENTYQNNRNHEKQFYSTVSVAIVELEKIVCFHIK